MNNEINIEKANKLMISNLNEYQNAALETAVYDEDGDPISYCILGLVGEAGEIANKYKKVLRGDKKLTPELKESITSEIGDVLWYTAALAKNLGFALEEVANKNITKLYERRINGTIKGDGDNR
jgi:NTP pyrophosphatase (non-canonical NTP hydrolase)